jgi:hypothetical protein
MIITPSLATRIIIDHNPISAKSLLECSSPHHQQAASPTFLSSLSPIALLSSAIAIIRICSSKRSTCPTCSPHAVYTAALGHSPASSLLAIDDPAYDLHVRPHLLNTPLGESLPRARVELRSQALTIADMIGLHADDVMWAFRYSSRWCCASCFSVTRNLE